MRFIPEGDENGSNIGFSQIHPTCLASSSVKVLARLAMPAHLVTISDRRQRTSANTLPRYDKRSVYLRSSFLGSSIDSCTIIEKVILTRGDTRQGNCKFGPKCANIHVLPDGRRINYGKNGVTIGTAPISLGSRINPTTYHQSSNSALTNSFMRAEGVPSPYALPSDERYGHQLGRQPSLENGLPTIDTTYSHPGSAYGSPRDEETNRFGLGLSPVNTKGLSVLDAPLPASFDSNGISHAARYGPWPSSVPSKFGLESPSPSLNNAKESRTSETLKLLHTSAFGSSDHLSSGNINDVMIGSSPPTHNIADEYFGKRAMHSSRYAKPRLLSSSAPKVDRDWEDNFLFFEEDYVPGALANEVLTPAEKARRGSLRASDVNELTGENSTTKYGSPINTASPSRWGPLFQRQKDEELEPGSGSLGKSLKGASAFGHVGSPLRNSSLASGIEVNGAHGRPAIGSRSTSNAESMSVLTQQIQRTRLGDDGSNSSPHLHPNAARSTSGSGSSVGIIGKERDRERGLERHVSSGSIGSSVTGRFTTPIDEEDPAFVFSMEEEDEATQLRTRKRISGGHVGVGVPPGWSYAGVAASKPNGTGSKVSSNSVEPVSGR